MEDKVVGIDLGTTNLCVVSYKHGVCEVLINDSNGARVTPSYVAFTKNEMIVGREAKKNAINDIQNTVYDSKRLIGRPFDDEFVQQNIKHWPFKVVDVDGYPMINVAFKNEQISFSPEQISALLLNKMKQLAQQKLNGRVRRAVITVPAYFNDRQRKATYKAANDAGLNVMKLINEPTAAAIAFALDKKYRGEMNALVYDLGGGTFDVSVLHINEGTITVNAVSGNTQLGGRDFDLRLLNHFVDEIKKTNLSVDLNNKRYKRAMARLAIECVEVKHSLSERDETNVFIDSLFDGTHFETEITRVKFEELCDDLFEETLSIVKKALWKAGLSKEDIDDIILVGGSTRIPKVRQLLQQFFEGKPVNHEVNPDEAVACGAAIMAARIKGDTDEYTNDLRVEDVTPLTYSVAVENVLARSVIPCNTKYPTTRTKQFRTSDDWQTELAIKIYQGERTLIKDNHFLAEFVFSNLPAKYSGELLINVTMAIDENGILEVIGTEESTGAKKRVYISKEKRTLTESQMDRHKTESQLHKADDIKERGRIEAWIAAKQLAQKLRKTMNENHLSGAVSDDTKTQVNKKVEEVLKWIKTCPKAQRSEIDSKYCELQQLKLLHIENDLRVEDVTPLTYSVAVENMLARSVIPCNTKYPTTRTTQFRTSDDWQTELSIKIYQGERILTKNNHFLAELVLKNLPSKYSGEVVINVTMAIDEEGILKVTGTEESTGVTERVYISKEKRTLTESEIGRHKSESELHKANDIKERSRIKGWIEVKQLAQKIRKTVNEKRWVGTVSDDSKKQVDKKVEEVLQWFKTRPKAKRSEIDSKYCELQELKRFHNI